MSALTRVRVYAVDDGDGHSDQMEEYDAKGQFYYASEADEKINTLLKALGYIRDGAIPQGMSPALFAAKVLETS